MSLPRETAGASTRQSGPWSPFWAAVRQAAEELRQARAAGQTPEPGAEK